MQNVELLHLFCKLTRELFLFVQKICQKGWCRANKAHAEPSYEKWKHFRLHFDIADELEYAPIQTRNGVHIWVDVSGCYGCTISIDLWGAMLVMSENCR